MQRCARGINRRSKPSNLYHASRFRGRFSFIPELSDFRIADTFPSTDGISLKNVRICAESETEQLFGRVLILESAVNGRR